MNHAKKYVLVEPARYREITRQLSSQRQRQQPQTQDSSSSYSLLDSDISEILNAKEPDDIKAKKYIYALSRYRNSSLPSSSRGGAFNSLTEDYSGGSIVEADILESVPVQSRYKAKRILRILRHNNETGWNSDAEFIYRQTRIPGSNLADLIGDVLRVKTVGDPPIGWREFAEALKTSRVPKDLVINRQIWKIVGGQSAKNDAEDPPTLDRYGTPPENSAINATPRNLRERSHHTPPPNAPLKASRKSSSSTSSTQSSSKKKKKAKKRKKSVDWEEY
jgi:hypothetical protein